MATSISLIIPTRERATYLGAAIATCIRNPEADFEILVLDNASSDETPTVVSGIRDTRIRYVRNERRLSMRDNFEKGLEIARGDVLCFIGDDDGVFPFSIGAALSMFRNRDIDAVSAARAHYFWPDLLSARRSSALLPRSRGVVVREAASQLRHVLIDNDYYRLPCLYHGFVRRSVVERIRRRQGRFFLSSQIDMYSSIALSAEGIHYAFSRSPLIINGASKRSNGASHFGGGSEEERSRWKQEDDLGFLPGFEGPLTVGSLIVESALRYVEKNPSHDIFAMLGREMVERALWAEAAKRFAAGRPIESVDQMFARASLSYPATPTKGVGSDRGAVARLAYLARAFANSRPIDMDAHCIRDVLGASSYMTQLLDHGHTGIDHQPIEQVATALRLTR